jgi:hypothetical protein
MLSTTASACVHCHCYPLCVYLMSTSCCDGGSAASTRVVAVATVDDAATTSCTNRNRHPHTFLLDVNAPLSHRPSFSTHLPPYCKCIISPVATQSHYDDSPPRHRRSFVYPCCITALVSASFRGMLHTLHSHTACIFFCTNHASALALPHRCLLSLNHRPLPRLRRDRRNAHCGRRARNKPQLTRVINYPRAAAPHATHINPLSVALTLT